MYFGPALADLQATIAARSKTATLRERVRVCHLSGENGMTANTTSRSHQVVYLVALLIFAGGAYDGSGSSGEAQTRRKRVPFARVKHCPRPYSSGGEE
jgi:hypothetical protein